MWSPVSGGIGYEDEEGGIEEVEIPVYGRGRERGRGEERRGEAEEREGEREERMYYRMKVSSLSAHCVRQFPGKSSLCSFSSLSKFSATHTHR